MANIRYAIDDARRRLMVTLSGIVTGHEFNEFARDFYGTRPELFDYECIIDLTTFKGDVGHADLKPLSHVYAQQAVGGASQRPGVIVTLDPNFHLWAAALDYQFPGRKHYVASSLEEAVRLLDDLSKDEAGA